MKAARLHAFGESLRIDSVEVPKVARDEVLLRIVGAGVCHTDLHIREGKFPPIWPFPFALGHENAGIVEAIGPDVTRFRPGDGVVVWGAHGCGNCRICHEGDEPPCGMEYWLGNGGYAEFMHIPSQRFLVRASRVRQASDWAQEVFRRQLRLRQVEEDFEVAVER